MHIIEKAYKKYYTRLYRYSVSLTKNKEKAEDILQDVVLRCLTHANLPDCEDRAFGYLISSIRNKYISEIRHQKIISKGIKGHTVDVSVNVHIDQRTAYEEFSNLAPSKQLESHEKYVQIRRYIESQFDVITSRVFVEKYLSEKPKKAKQIAIEIGETPNQVDYRIRQCRAALKNFKIS